MSAAIQQQPRIESFTLSNTKMSSKKKVKIVKTSVSLYNLPWKHKLAIAVYVLSTEFLIDFLEKNESNFPEIENQTSNFIESHLVRNGQFCEARVNKVLAKLLEAIRENPRKDS
jgi:hypothetical protein